MRIRQIKPEFWKHEGLGELSRDARLLFIGLWGMADCVGRLENRPKRIKAELFPYDEDLNALTIQEWLNELSGHPEKFLIQYEVDGQKYIEISNLVNHQHFMGNEKNGISKFPAIPGKHGKKQVNTESDKTVLVRTNNYESNNNQKNMQKIPSTYSVRTNKVKTEKELLESISDKSTYSVPTSTTDIRLYGYNGVTEGQSYEVTFPESTLKSKVTAHKAPTSAGPKEKRTHRIPEDWEPDDKLIAWAGTKYPQVDIRFQTDKFVNHFIAKGTRYIDWGRAWQNWIMSSSDYLPNSKNANRHESKPSTPSRIQTMLAFPYLKNRYEPDVIIPTAELKTEPGLPGKYFYQGRMLDINEFYGVEVA